MSSIEDVDKTLVKIADWYHDHLSEYSRQREVTEFGLGSATVYSDEIDELDGLITEAQLTVDEMLNETCHLVTESADARDWPNNQRCDQCGEYVAVVSPEVVRYCPSCGRRIVE